MLAHWVESISKHRKERFAEPFYIRYRSHVPGWGMIGCGGAWLVAWLVGSGTAALLNVVPLFTEWGDATPIGWGDRMRAGVASLLFFLVVLSVVAGIRDDFRVRVLPYFERRVGEIDTWLAGQDLLWHSRALDEEATRCGLTPLSAFASGDDLIWGEQLHWFEPTEALRTAERLLKPDVAAALPAGVVMDLNQLRGALQRACAQGIRFCLLLREGSAVSGHEMSLRKGSFF